MLTSATTEAAGLMDDQCCGLSAVELELEAESLQHSSWSHIYLRHLAREANHY